MPTLGEVLLFLIENGPDRTELELAEAVFGNRAYQQRVNQDCRLLVDRGLVDRLGRGGPSDPFRYRAPARPKPGLPGQSAET